MPKFFNSTEAARELGLSPLYAAKFFKTHGVAKTCGVYMIDEATLKRLKAQRAKQAPVRKRGAA